MAVRAREAGGPGQAGPLMPSKKEPSPSLAAEFRRILGPQSRILAEGAELELYARDQADIPETLRRMLIRTVPDLVIQPETVEDVANVVSAAYDLGIPVVPRAGASFPLGGSVPTMGGIALDLSSLRRILSIDRIQRLADVEAGVRWSTLSEQLRGDGLALRTYPSSWFSSVGGWVSTGGYGINSLTFGHLSRNVAAIQVVTPTGGIEWIDETHRDFSLYFGTEGQLGIVTRVVVKVRPMPKAEGTSLLHFATAEEAFAFASELLEAGPPMHMLYFDPHRMQTLNRLMPQPFLREAHSLLVRVEDGSGPTLERRASGKGSLAPHHHGAYLWRERFFPLKPKRLGPGVLGSELIVDEGAATAVFEEWRRIADRAGLVPETEAHFLDGRRVLGLCTFLTDPRQSGVYAVHSVLAVHMTMAGVRLGGRPYGTGIWQTPMMAARFGEEEALRLRREKLRRDPKGLLNPGKFFAIRSRYANLLGLAMTPPLANVGLRLLGPLLPSLARMTYRPPSAHGTVLEASAIECSSCGACVPVCPAYMATGSELVTGRGKLQLASKLLSGRPVRPEDAHAMFLCIHCGACERVCQSELPLVKAYEDLEALVAGRFGVPRERIDAFAAAVQESKEYRQLLGAGMVPEAFYTYKEGRSGGV